MARVLFFLPSLAAGGAERVTVDLCRSLAEGGDDVLLVLGSAEGPTEVEQTPGHPFRVVDLAQRRAVTAIVPLARLLRRERPDVVVGVIVHAGLVAAIAHRLARSRARLIVMQHNQLSVNIGRSRLRRDRMVPATIHALFRRVDLVCAVSRGVAEDFAASTSFPPERIRVFPNPIDWDRIESLSRAPLPDGVGAAPGTRLLVAAGRLTEQKDFASLLRAVAGLTRADWRLVILGEGPLRADLEAQVALLGLGDRVLLPGHVANPYPVFRAADVYVMSSQWEGLPTVLLEVMAFPTAIVSTDCPSGPREILEGGRHGTLVPVGDVEELTRAIEGSLREGASSADRDAVRERFEPASVAARFRDLWQERAPGRS